MNESENRLLDLYSTGTVDSFPKKTTVNDYNTPLVNSLECQKHNHKRPKHRGTKKLISPEHMNLHIKYTHSQELSPTSTTRCRRHVERTIHRHIWRYTTIRQRNQYGCNKQRASTIQSQWQNKLLSKRYLRKNFQKCLTK